MCLGVSAVSDDYETALDELKKVYLVDFAPPKHVGILLKGQIVLFGTCHPLQFGERSDADSHQFQNELKRVCCEHDIQLITEECTEDVTPQRPLVQEVARDLDLKYVPVDISLEDRLKLKIADANLSDVTFQDLVRTCRSFNRPTDAKQCRENTRSPSRRPATHAA